MTDAALRKHAWTFGGAAAAYERTWPGYPRPAVTWALQGAAGPVRRVLDLGAGGLDRRARMLDVLAEAVPGAECHQGTAEDLPLPDASVDAVVCGQAWHWVEPAQTVPEVVRVLRPGGVLGLLWNLRDERVGWVAALGEAMDNHEDVIGVLADPEAPPRLADSFGPAKLLVVEHAHRLAPADLRELALSRSHVLTREPSDRDRVLSEVEQLTATHPDLAGRDVVDVPYTTVAWRSRLASTA